MKRTPMLNNYEQQLKHPICENIDEKENGPEDYFSSYKIELNRLIFDA